MVKLEQDMVEAREMFAQERKDLSQQTVFPSVGNVHVVFLNTPAKASAACSCTILLYMIHQLRLQMCLCRLKPRRNGKRRNKEI